MSDFLASSLRYTKKFCPNNPQTSLIDPTKQHALEEEDKSGSTFFFQHKLEALPPGEKKIIFKPNESSLTKNIPLNHFKNFEKPINKILKKTIDASTASFAIQNLIRQIKVEKSLDEFALSLADQAIKDISNCTFEAHRMKAYSSATYKTLREQHHPLSILEKDEASVHNAEALFHHAHAVFVIAIQEKLRAYLDNNSILFRKKGEEEKAARSTLEKRKDYFFKSLRKAITDFKNANNDSRTIATISDNTKIILSEDDINDETNSVDDDGYFTAEEEASEDNCRT